MSQFVKNVFASCLGMGLALVLTCCIGVFLIVAIASSSSGPQVKVSKNSVLQLNFSQAIPEQTNNIPINPLQLETQEVLGLSDILYALDHAAKDEKIKGIYLNLDEGISTGMATATSLRNGLLDFKKSGKFIVANSKYYTQGAYYIASAADKVYLNPLGSIDFHGFSVMIPFFKELLDKAGVKMQVFYAGNFKSATEPYRLTKMSDENRLQLREYIEPVFHNFLTDIGTSRNKPVAALRAIADSLSLRTAEDAVKLGLVDATGYNDDVIRDLKARLELGEKEKLKTVSLRDYTKSYSKDKNYKAKDKIALVYAEGSILVNQGDRGNIIDDKYIKLLRKIREDEKTKAIVLRVNSPGGSAIASENIWRELVLAKEAGKKIVVSMGDYAASGGYYISCMADKIIAEPNTLTGSIGVFQMLPNLSHLSEEKLGVHWDSVKTTNYSTGLNPYFEPAPTEQQFLQQVTNEMYEIFLQRVAQGRNMSRDSVHAIAQGRIWVGSRAKEIGLVDEIGTLDDAIHLAADLAGVENYRLTEYPIQKEPLQELVEKLTGQSSDDNALRAKLIRQELGQYYPYYKEVREMLNMKDVQARLPLLIEFR